MQPYQTFSNNNYTQFQPMYQPMQNLYMDNRLANLQQYPQSMQPQQSIYTRIVDNFDSITANDVSMQGGSIFIKNDGTEIQLRKWTSQGTIETTSYLAQKSNLSADAANSLVNEKETAYGANKDVLEGIMNKVDMLSEKIDEILKQKPTARGKKEVSADE